LRALSPCGYMSAFRCAIACRLHERISIADIPGRLRGVTPRAQAAGRR